MRISDGHRRCFCSYFLSWPGSEARLEVMHRTDVRPRRTGDGYYECVIGDPEGNRVEMTVR